MKILTRTLLLGAALVSLSPAADASRFARTATTRTATTSSSSSSARRPSRVTRFLLGALQRGRSASGSQQLGRQAASQRVRTGLRPEARQEIAANAQMMEGSIYQSATPPFALVHMDAGATVRQTRQSNYKKGVTARFEVTGLQGGAFPVTALLPVSGHVGPAEAARYARTNVYSGEIEYADGTTETMRVNATGYVTEKLLDLKLKKGTNYVRFAPEGSGGVGGFRSGREIELEYDGN
jgi:hypothetical protein